MSIDLLATAERELAENRTSVDRLEDVTTEIENLRFRLASLHTTRCLMAAQLRNKGVSVREMTEAMHVTKQAVYLMLAKANPKLEPKAEEPATPLV